MLEQNPEDDSGGEYRLGFDPVRFVNAVQGSYRITNERYPVSLTWLAGDCCFFGHPSSVTF